MDTQPQNPQAQKPSSGIAKAISEHPYFTVICGLATLFGTGFGIWGYCVSIKEPNLTYYISPNRTPIVQNGKLNNLSVKYQNVNVNGDLTGATIQIWNAGKQAIHTNEIERPVSIKTQNGDYIYSSFATNSRAEIGGVLNFQMGILTNWFSPNYTTNFLTNNWAEIVTHLQSNSLAIATNTLLSWNILEHNDAIKIDILYGGNEQEPILVNAVVEGQQKGITKYKDTNSKYGTRDLCIGIFLLTYSTGIFILFKWRTSKLRPFQVNHRKGDKLGGQKIKVILIIFFAFLIAMVAEAGYLLYGYFTSLSKPPFGF